MHSLHLYEDDIKRLFIEALSTLLSDRTTRLEDCRLLYDTLINTTDLERESQALLEEMDKASNLVRRLIEDDASALSLTEYTEQYDSLTARFNKAKTDTKGSRKQRITAS